MTHSPLLQEARSRVAKARMITILTGAGISADSGVPTFRGPDGLWRNFRAEDLATPEAFQRNPKLVWEWYNWRREIIATKRPNPAHYALAELERRLDCFWLLTQNVDGLHQAAGSQKVSELHGNIWKVRCTVCGQVTENRAVPIPILPLCPTCGGLLRPHIVWFGEALSAADLDHSRHAAGSCEVMIVIGTSGLVYPAAALASLARMAGAFVIEVNRELTPYGGIANVSFQGLACEVVPLLLGCEHRLSPHDS